MHKYEYLSAFTMWTNYVYVYTDKHILYPTDSWLSFA